MTPLDEWSARRRDLYLTTHNIHNMPPVGFEPTISEAERPQTDALEGAATGTAVHDFRFSKLHILSAVISAHYNRIIQDWR
jgi:hypothetical protein